MSLSSATDLRKKTIPYSYILNTSKALLVNSTAKETELVIKNGFLHGTQIKQPDQALINHVLEKRMCNHFSVLT